MRDSFRTISAGNVAEIPRIRGSRFIAEVWPTHSVKEAEERIQSTRKREHAATHHCYAYRLGAESAAARYSDDGEPNGSAGLPILRQIEVRDLTNVVVIVTRYFGGVKLGTGGLSRAYADAAGTVLDEATVVERILRVPVCIRFSYPDTSPALHVVSRFDTAPSATRYDVQTEMDLEVRVSQVEDFIASFLEALQGRGAAEVRSIQDAGE